MPDNVRSELVKAAVVTGGHSYDVPNFHNLWRSIPGVQIDVLHMDDFATSPEEDRDGYEVVLFYMMPTETPADEPRPGHAGRPKASIEHLGETEQGIFVLHHSLLAYPQWELWNQLVGIDDRSFDYRPTVHLRIDIANADHPITQGLEPWEIDDETYIMASAGTGSDVLLTTDNEECMRTLGWTRQHGKSRMFCFVPGHDNTTWTNPGFCEVVRRGLLWCARRI